MDPNLALLFSKGFTLREVHSAEPDAPQIDPQPTFRERLRARSAARSEARSSARARVYRQAVRAAEQVVRAARPAARSATPTAGEPAAGGYTPDGSDGLVVVMGIGGRAGQPDWTPPISRRSSRALCACSCRHSTAYDDATIWLVDVKSRFPRENEYVRTANSRPKAPPMKIAGTSGLCAPGLVDRLSRSPTKRPNHAPDRNPPSAAREVGEASGDRLDHLQVGADDRHQLHGNALSARWSTAFCASR